MRRNIPSRYRSTAPRRSRSKLSCMLSAASMASTRSHLRFGHVYGPGRTTECFIREMLAAAAEKRPCHIPQVSTSLRQYVHIDDVCRSIALAMEVEAPRSRVFNIAAGEIHTLGEVADVVQRVVGPLEVRFDAERDLPNYRIEKMSISRARGRTGLCTAPAAGRGYRKLLDVKLRAEVLGSNTPAAHSAIIAATTSTCRHRPRNADRKARGHGAVESSLFFDYGNRGNKRASVL